MSSPSPSDDSSASWDALFDSPPPPLTPSAEVTTTTTTSQVTSVVTGQLVDSRQPSTEPEVDDEIDEPPSLESIPPTIDHAASILAKIELLELSHARNLRTVTLLAALNSATPFVSLGLLGKGRKDGTFGEVDFSLVRDGRSIVGSWMKLAAEVLGVPASLGAPNPLSAAGSRAKEAGLASLRDQLMPQLKAAQLTTSQRVMLLGHIIASCAPKSATQADVVMHELISVVLAGDASSKDLTRALIVATTRGRVDLIWGILLRVDSFKSYGLVIDPFFTDGSGHSLASVLKSAAGSWPMRVPQCLALLDEMKETITSSIVPIVLTVLPQYDITIDSTLSAPQLATKALEFIDCFGRPTAALLQLLTQSTSAASETLTAQLEQKDDQA